MNIFELEDAPPKAIDSLPVDVLYNLQHQAEAHAASAARIMAIVHGALSRRYADGLNDTGTHHRSESGFDITVTIPKRIDWDQEKIAEAVETIRGWGEDPSDYVDIRTTVAENKFKAWPPALRDLFAPARTVKAGKAKIEIAPVSEKMEAA